MKRAAPALALLASLAAFATQGAAQQMPAPDAVHSRPREATDSAPSPSVASIFHRSDLYILAGFTAATVAMFPLDREIAAAVRDSQLVENRELEEAAKIVGFLGSPGPFLIGAGMYAFGRLSDRPRVAHVAVHGTEAIFVGLVAAGMLKASLGRARPYVSADPSRWDLLEGFTKESHQSFPSGHSTTTFAVASAVTLEMAHWHPRSVWIVGPVLYGGAALVGLSRMYEDKHWASDVVMGAAIGTFAGLKTVAFTHTRAGNRIDRWLLGKSNGAPDGAPNGAPGGAPNEGFQLRVLPISGGVLLTATSRW